jgi:hypothetical protein
MSNPQISHVRIQGRHYAHNPKRGEELHELQHGVLHISGGVAKLHPWHTIAVVEYTPESIPALLSPEDIDIDTIDIDTLAALHELREDAHPRADLDVDREAEQPEKLDPKKPKKR